MKPTKNNHMLDLLALQKQFILAHLREGDKAVDFTMGNGHDTAFLSKAVGPEGHVWAFDIQPAALESSAKTLEAEGCPDNVTLICASHHRVREFVEGPIRAGMFNLGYLRHAEGEAEGKMLAEYFATLDRRKICATQIKIVNSPTSPFFFVLETK